MTSRQTRSPSIPIPRSTSATPGRPFTPIIRPRISSAGTSIHRAVDEYRSLSVAGMRGSSSLATSSPMRMTTRSFAHSSGMPNRISPRSLTVFEPRVIRDTSRTTDNLCASSSSTSPSRNRRPSTAETKISSTQKPSVAYPPTPTPAPNTFPRPAYLEHSALRHLLQTDSPPNLPPLRTNGEVQFSATRARAPSTPTDSDDESNVSLPQEVPPAPLFSHYPILRLPTRWSEKYRHPSLSISSDGRELSFQGQASNGEKEAATARTTHPISSACGIYYYEVEIVSKGQRGHIGIGFNGPDVKPSRLPGWEPNSWGYHGDDGLCFASEKNGTPYGPIFTTGDVIGCGIDFSINRVFYTRNGGFLGHVFESVGKDCEIYPAVGLRHSGEAVRVNFGQEPFKFDIEYHIQQQHTKTWAKIQSTPLDHLFQDEKAGAKPENVQPISEETVKGLIDQLVLSYLAHHGYAKTARAFQTQREKRGGLSRRIQLFIQPSVLPSADDHDMDIDDVPQRGLGPGMSDGDIELRTRLVNFVIVGDIDMALAETQTHYPAVLEREEGLMLFKLRCRKFVEMILEAAEMKKRMKAEEDMTEEGLLSDGMDVDDDIHSPPPFASTNGFGGSAAIAFRGKRKRIMLSGARWSGAAIAQYETALKKAISYGQALQSDYKGDRRPEVLSLCTRTFSIVGCYDPLEEGGDVAEVAGQEARVVLANELNQAILKSQGRPGLPALEQLYRQASACILQLGLSGVGAAAFADMPKELLDA